MSFNFTVKSESSFNLVALENEKSNSSVTTIIQEKTRLSFENSLTIQTTDIKNLNKNYSLKDPKTEISLTLVKLGLDEELIKDFKPEFLKKMIMFLMSNHHMQKVVVNMLNKDPQFLKSFKDRNKKTVDYQTRVLQRLGISTVDTSDKHTINESTDKLYHMVANNIDSAEDIAIFFKNFKVNIEKFHNTFESFKTVEQQKGTFLATNVYKLMGSLKLSKEELLGVENEAKRIRSIAKEMLVEKKELKNTAEQIKEILKNPIGTVIEKSKHFFIITPKSEIYSCGRFLGTRGHLQDIYTLVRVNEQCLNSLAQGNGLESHAIEESNQFVHVIDGRRKNSFTEWKDTIRKIEKINSSNLSIPDDYEIEVTGPTNIFAIQKPKLLKELVIDQEGTILEISEKVHTASDNIGMPATDILKMYADVTEGIVQLHEVNIIHGNIKNSNIVIHKKSIEILNTEKEKSVHKEELKKVGSDQINVINGSIKAVLTNFEYSKDLGQNENVGTRGGSTYYFAPETIETKQISKKTDSFNLGVSMIKTLTREYGINIDDECVQDHAFTISSFGKLTESQVNDVMKKLKVSIHEKIAKKYKLLSKNIFEKDLEKEIKIMNEFIQVVEQLIKFKPEERLSCKDALIKIQQVLKEVN